MPVTLEGKARYQVLQELGGNEHSRFYKVASSTRGDQELMLKIVKGVEYNSVFDREALLLTNMRERAFQLEVEYARVRPDAGQLNYQVGFPECVETFVAKEQGNRRAIVLGFDATGKIGKLQPISLIRTRERVRVDPKTSVWVLGKLLKILAFAHDQFIEVGDLTGGNILIVPDHHIVTIFNWSKGQFYGGKLQNDVVRGEIRAATRSVLLLLGGDPDSGALPEDEQLADHRYEAFLAALLRGVYTNARAAHAAFYKLVEVLWERKFHPYATYPLNQGDRNG